MSRHHLPALLLAAALAGSSCVQAGDDTGGRFGLALDAGFAAIDAAPYVSADTTPFYLAFQGHWRFSEQWRAGITAGGFLLQASDVNNPAKGAGISQLLVSIEARPFADRRGWIEGGLGTATFWNHAPGGSNDSGMAWQVQAGHDLYRAGNTWVAPFIAAGDNDGNRNYMLGLRIDWQR